MKTLLDSTLSVIYNGITYEVRVLFVANSLHTNEVLCDIVMEQGSLTDGCLYTYYIPTDIHPTYDMSKAFALQSILDYLK